MKTLKQTSEVDSRGAESTADDPLRSGSLPAEITPSQTSPLNGVDEMVSSFLLELNAISNPWGSASGADNPDKVDPNEVAISKQGEDSSESIRPAGDDFPPIESRAAVADLDRRIASLLDELEKEQGKATPLPLRETVKPELARSPAPESAVVVAQPIQELLGTATKPGPSGALAQGGAPNHEAARAAAKPEAGAASQRLVRAQSRSRRIPAMTRILAPAGLLGAAAAIWIFVGSPWFGKEKTASVTPTAPAATISQVFVAEQPEAAPASIPKTAAAKPIPSQPAGSDSQRGVAGAAESQARARSGNPGQATAARVPLGPDPKAPAQMIEIARGLPAQPSEPNTNVTAVRPVQELSRTAPAAEPAPPTVASPIRNMPVSTSAPLPAETTASNAPSAQLPPAVSTNAVAVQPPETRASPDPVRGTSAAPAVPSAAGTLAVREQPTTSYLPPKPPVAIRKIVPEYPPLAKRLGISGTVVVSVDVSEEGNVVRAVAVSGPSQLRTAAEDALKKWKFAPATQNGVKAESSLSVSVVFSP